MASDPLDLTAATAEAAEAPAAPPPALPTGRGPVLLLDDERALRRAFGLFLRRRGFQVEEAAEAVDALSLLERERVAVVVADLELSSAGGIEFLDAAKSRRPDVEVVFTTGRPEPRLAYEALKRGAVDVFRKPFLFNEVAVALQRALERRELRAKSLELERIKEREQVSQRHTMQVLASMATLLDAKSKYTREHSDRVCRYAIDLAHGLHLAPERVRVIGFGGKIHDIGKIGVPDAVLNKPGPLTREERQAIALHPTIGEQCLAPLPLMNPFVCMVGGHHENVDGSGYPRGLQGPETPLEARIVRICDYYDAITSFRPYRDPMSRSQAVELLRAEKGKALDAELVEVFVRGVVETPGT